MGELINKRYQIESEIGRGGMGIVYQARDTVLERDVAVKVVSASAIGSQGRVRLLQEARAAASLNHVNIVAVYDAGELDGPDGQSAFIVMELVDGRSLQGYRVDNLEKGLEIARQICAALSVAHQKGIIHRDLKPENVLLSSTGDGKVQLKLMDFGLARVTGASRLSQEGTITGTFAYLAPELIMGRSATPQSDLYAFGVVLYELFTGRPPFEGDNPAVLLTNHLHATVVPPGAHNEAIPASLEALIVQMLAKEPERRPDSAADVLAALTEPSQPAPDPADLSEAGGIPSLLERIARGRLVGRESELAEATALLLRALNGDSHFLLVSGEPGIGKTRLGQAVTAQAELAGAGLLRGGCYEYEAATPYLPLAEALRDWVKGQSDEVLRERLGPVAGELARLAPEIRERLGDIEPAPSLSPNEERMRLYDSVARFLAGEAAGSGLVLFVDDLHWADKGTLALLSYLLRRLRKERLLILAAYREVELDRKHPLADALVEWNRERLATRIQLSRFGVDETNAMLATLFGQRQVSAEFAQAIHRETEGNPFFIEEVVKSLVEQGQIYRVGKRWEREELGELAIPQSIKEAVGRRLNHLTEPCIKILHTAAVIGKDFPFDILAEVSGAGEEAVLDALEEASGAQLIRPAEAESFVFTHDKIREVLYEEQISIRRNRLHRRIGQALEARPNGSGEAPVADLAYHFVAAGSLDKGMEYAIRAAQSAARLYAHEEALAYYEQARECAVSLDNMQATIDIDEAAGDLYEIMGIFPGASEAYRRALDATRDPAHRASLKVKLGAQYAHVGDDRGRALLKQAVEELDPERQANDLAYALAALGRFHHLLAEYGQAIDYYQQARRLAEPLDDPLTLSYIYAYLAGAYQHLANWQESLHWAQTCIEMGRRLKYPLAEAVGHEFLAEDYGGMGLWEKAIDAADKDYAIGDRIGSLDRMGWALFVKGWAFCYRGDLLQAVETLSRSLEMAEDLGEHRLEVLVLSFITVASADLENDDEAFRYAQRALKAADSVEELQMAAWAHRCMGYYHMRREEWEEALFYFLKDHEIVGSTQAAGRHYPTLYRASILVTLNRIDEAAELTPLLLEAAKEFRLNFILGQAYVVAARIAAARGETSAAQAAFNEAIAVLEEIGSLLELGRALFHRGCWARDRGRIDQAREDLTRAKSLFESCAATRDIGKATSALKRLT